MIKGTDPHLLPETVVALTLFAECRGESEEGQQAVASVIVNRAVKHLEKGFDAGLPAALGIECIEPEQFSCWKDDIYLGKEPYPITRDGQGVVNPEYDIWLTLLRLACDMCLADFVPTIDANLYHTVDCHPSWSEGLTPVATIGKHIF